MAASLDIVIVNWNSGPCLRACVQSIAAARCDGFELLRVVVVDNASGDGSADLPAIATVPLVVLRNRENRGFAAACNQGAAGSEADYILFLNPDTRLFANSLIAPIGFLEKPENSQVGICGIQLVDATGRVSRTCVRFMTPGRLLSMMSGLCHLAPRFFPRQLMVEWDHMESRLVDQVMGAFFLVRASVFRTLGGFDERFFVYCEEQDFAYRALQAGWTTYYLATAQAFHKGQGTIDNVFGIAFFYLLRSRVLYAFKHFGSIWGTILLASSLTVEPVSRTLFALVNHSYRSPSEVLRAYVLLWKNLPHLAQAKPLK